MPTAQAVTKAKKPLNHPEGTKVPRGLEMVPKTRAEVSGHALGSWSYCWHCEAPNYVQINWNFFYCHKCRSLNAI